MFLPLLLAAYGAGGKGSADRKNIVFIMADDLNADWKNDRLEWMPNLKRYFKEGGTYFENHVAAQPVCGPSRSSLLLGRYPHNTGYVSNSDDASTAAYLKQHNDTTGTWLTKAGYYTAFFGKYVNGCEGWVPQGWSWWGAFLNTYDFYNATVWEKDWEDPHFGPPRTRTMTDIHQADFLGNFTVEHARKAVASSRPFFISVTPVMPHWGTCYGPGPDSVYPPYDPHWEWSLPSGYSMPISPCPTNRNRHKFDGQSNPRIPGVWNVSITGPRPLWHQSVDIEGHLTEVQAYREDLGWRNRSAAIVDLDEMIGVIMDGITGLGVLDDTFVFFTSDNGYHLGEHKMPFGKGEPYDTDVRLPLYVRGPGVLTGRVLPHPTNHIDITATIVELAGATSSAPSNLDGLSFASELSNPSDPVSLADSWRQHSYSEFFGAINTWRLVRVVNSTHKFSYMWWCTNDTEIYNMKEDSWQRTNIYGSEGFAQAAVADAGRIVNALGTCQGDECSHPTVASGPPANGSLNCYKISNPVTERPGSFEIIPNPAGGFDLSGWLINTIVDNGEDAVTAMFRIDSFFYKNGLSLPFVTANGTRTDLPYPSKNHGFKIARAQIPPALFHGKHTLTLFGRLGDGKPQGYGGHTQGQQNNGKSICVCDAKVCPCKV